MYAFISKYVHLVPKCGRLRFTAVSGTVTYSFYSYKRKRLIGNYL